jgi:hypothetical protein
MEAKDNIWKGVGSAIRPINAAAVLIPSQAPFFSLPFKVKAAAGALTTDIRAQSSATKAPAESSRTTRNWVVPTKEAIRLD